MSKPIFFLSWGFIFSSLAMENSRPFLPWVESAAHIRVQSLKLDNTFPINNATRILDIKNMLYNNEGIPVDQQTLRAYFRRGLWGRVESENLDDYALIKVIMSQFNTDIFKLYLSLKPRHNHNNNQ